MTAEPDRCRPVEVDGDTIRVHSVGELTDTDKALLAELVRAVKRQFERHLAERCTCGHQRGEHRIDLQRAVCTSWHIDDGHCDCREYTPQEAR